MFHGEVVKLISNQRRKGRPRDVCKGRLKIKLILKRLTEKFIFESWLSLYKSLRYSRFQHEILVLTTDFEIMRTGRLSALDKHKR